jgi:hypothetical protein
MSKMLDRIAEAIMGLDTNIISNEQQSTPRSERTERGVVRESTARSE